MNVGTAVFSAVARFGPLIAESKKAQEAMEQVGSKAKGVGPAAEQGTSRASRALSGLWSGAGKVLKVGAAATGAAVGGIFTASLAKGFGRLTAIDAAQGKLRGLGHDAKSVETIMTSALDAVRGTAFGLDAAATTAAGAVAAGIKPGKELTAYLSTVGDTAAIAGVSMEEMGSVMNKVTTAQTAYTNDLNMLADRGIPIFKWLQDEYNVTAEELRDMVADGKVSAADYQKVLQDNIGGAAKEMGNTFKGALANTWAALGRVGANLLAPAFEMATGGLNTVMTALEPVEGVAKKVGEALGNSLGRGVEIVSDLFQRARPFIEGVFKVLTGQGTGMLAKALDVPQDHPAIKVLQGIRDFVTDDIPAGARKAKDVVEGLLNLFTGKGTGGLAKALGVEQSDTVIKVFTGIRDVVKDLGPWITGTLVPALGSIGSTIVTTVVPHAQALWDVLMKVGDVLVNDVAPVLLDIGQAVLPVLADALSVVGGFLADHTGIVLAVIGAWAGFRAVMAVMSAYRALMVIVAAVKAGYAAATYGAVGATYAQSAAERAGMVIGYAKIAMMKAATVAQKAWNLAMKMNPIGLLIIAITALVGALVWLYKNNEDARRIMDAAWAGIKKGIDAVVSWFRNTAWPWMRDAMAWIADKARWLWQNELKPAWDGIRNAISAVVTWFRDTAWPWMRDTFNNLRDKASDTKDRVVSAWDAIRSGISSGWDKIKAIFDKFKDGLQAVRNKFGDVRDGISKVWGGLAGILVGPINGVIDLVNRFLRGLHRMLSKIPGVKGKLGAEWGTIPHVMAPGSGGSGGSGKAVVALARGGRVPGFSSSERADNIPAMLTADEEVIRRRSARRMRKHFPGWMEHVNKHGRPPGYADGGRVGNRKPRTGGEAVLSTASDWLMGLWSNATDWVKKRWDELIPDGFGDSWAGIVGKGLLSSIDLSGLASWVKEKFLGSQEGGGGGVNYGGPFGWNPNGMMFPQIIAMIRSVVPNAIISSTFRGGAITASGIPSLHGLGRAVDWFTPGMVGMVQAFRRVGALARWSQHFYTPAGAASQHGYVDANIRRMHHDHAHTAMRYGGRVPGSGRGDRTNVLAEPGEYMVNRRAARRWGPLLAAINTSLRPGGGTDLLSSLSHGYGLSDVRSLPGIAAPARLGKAALIDAASGPSALDMSEESLDRLAALLDRHARRVSAKTVAEHDLDARRRRR